MNILVKAKIVFKIFFSFDCFIAFLITALYVFFGVDISYSQLMTANTTVISLAGVLLGFLITAMTILITFTDKILIINMKKTGHYAILLENMSVSFILLSLVIMIGLINLFIIEVTLFKLLIAFLIFFTALSFLYLGRTGNKFFSVIRNL